jgi:YggT family protein
LNNTARNGGVNIWSRALNIAASIASLSAPNAEVINRAPPGKVARYLRPLWDRYMLGAQQDGFRAMLELLRFINFLLDIYIFVLFAAAILSWLIVFNVVNTRNSAVAMIGEFLYRVTEPVLRPIRDRLPNFGGIDISFIVVILIILFIRGVILPVLARAII